MTEKVSQLEQRVADKLKSIGAAQLQRLTEDLAVARDRARYQELQVHGRNPEDQTTDGWPDAYVARGDGTLDAVEATRERYSWQRHLESDLAKVRDSKRPRVSGYLFVGGIPRTRPKIEELDHWKQEFCRAGIPTDRVTILLGMGLVRELCQPRYARVRQVHLNIPPAPELFELVRIDRPPLGAGPFVPSSEEFLVGTVYRPGRQEEIMASLNQTGCALLRGRGAAGKTVMAHSIAVDPAQRGLPAYRLDLSPFGNQTGVLRGRIEKQIVEFGDEGVLFIIDNVHLDEDLIASVYENWRELAQPLGARLLLVGREVHRLSGSALEATDLVPVVHRAQSAEVLGVFRRILIRNGVDPKAHEPADAVMRTWIRTFGGDPASPNYSVDLMAFGAAVEHRIPSIIKDGDFSLTVEDARLEIRNSYLVGKNPEELQNLLRLSALPQDVPLPEEGLKFPYAGFESFIRAGIVFETRPKADQTVRYTVAHSALGKLILGAASPPVDRLEECLAVADKCSLDLIFIAQRAAVDDDLEIAKKLLEAMLTNPDWLLRVGGKDHLPFYLDFSSKLGVPLISSEERPVDFDDKLVAVSMEMGLHFLGNLLSYLSNPTNKLTSIHLSLSNGLLLRHDKVLERVFGQSVDSLLGFLQDIRGSISPLRRLYDYLLGGLVRERTRISKVAKDAPLSQLSAFLRFSRTAGAGMRAVYKETLNQLSESLPEISVRATNTALGALLQFLSEVSDSTSQGFISNNVGDDLCKMIDLEEWNAYRRLERLPSPTDINNMHRLFKKLGRFGLAETPARRMIDAPASNMWSARGVILRQLADVVECCGTVPPASLTSFFDRAVLSEWLDRNYSAARTSSLAGALIRLAVRLPTHLHQRLCTNGLSRRVSADLAAAGAASNGVREEIISLAGCVALLGGMVPAKVGDWLDNDAVAQMSRDRRPIDARLSYYQIQFWLGIRSLAPGVDRPIRIPASDGSLLLEVWGSAVAPSTFAAAVNLSMTDWLERCRADGWTVPRDGYPSVRSHVLENLGFEGFATTPTQPC
ncbi:MAG TPA: hypothetical protein VK614_02775 [Allosphingosinicella sp.]|nr:hypothetical protein [Allosphingosinicella sp.]